MSKALLIVESPTKARTLSRYLGNRFQIHASVGHIKDLPENDLGVDIDNGFEPRYQVIKGKEKIIRQLKKAATGAEAVYLAPDPDREGEAIAWHIAEEIGPKVKQIYRVLFNELTRNAIEEALQKPGALDPHKYEAQQARRLLDRLVGYKVSPLLWDKVRRGLSAGRVQSVALRLICEREAEIQRFESREYWTIDAVLAGPQPPEFKARLWRHKGRRLTVDTEQQASDHADRLRQAAFLVERVEKKERSRPPAPPFITSTLQQEAARKLRFSAKKTMTVAQRLYEGVELGSQGPTGLITYMRTDSTRLAADAVKAAREWIKAEIGEEFVPKRPPVYKRSKAAQDAHEAIRPTAVNRTPEKVAPYLSKDELALYELIWKRFVASQMAPARFDQTTVVVQAGEYELRATGSILKFPGFMHLYTEGVDNGDEAAAEKEPRLPELQQGLELRLVEIQPTQHFTQPPPRYTEATLIRDLEEKGIGRPSTYASILSVIQSKEYTVKEKGRFKPTELGMLVNALLVANFPDVFDVSFTAQMEEKLDEIEGGKYSWRRLLEDFYQRFALALERAEQDMVDVKRAGLPTEVDCDQCGRKMHIRWGRNGLFLSCSGYPECTNSKNFTRDEKGQIQVSAEGKVMGSCELCGRDMVVRDGRFGPFLACSGYPECKNTVSLNDKGEPQAAEEAEATGENCPRCGGNLVVRRSRLGGRFVACDNYPKCRYTRAIGIGVDCPQEGCDGEVVARVSKKGRRFYGCSRYPQCRFTSWSEPVAQPCPECGSPYLVRKGGRDGRQYLACPRKGCRHQEPAAE